MLTIEIVNDGTGDEITANYKYRIRINTKEVARGKLKGHLIMSGWQGLLSYLDEKINGDRFRQ